MSKSPLNLLVVGGGSIGGLMAHELSLQHPKSLSLKLMFKNSESLNLFKRKNSQLTIDRIDEGGNRKRTNAHIQGSTFKQYSEHEIFPRIDNLILATKCHKSFTALAPYVKYLHKDSNILFIQNGMGLMEQMMEHFWPASISERPNFFKAIVTHGAYKSSPSVINHIGLGNISLSYFPKTNEIMTKTAVPDIINILLNTHNLNVNYIENFQEFKLKELEKLAVNCCINPLTAIFDCLNGDLLEGNRVLKLMKAILSEFLLVIRKDNPELFRNLPEANSYLNIDRLLNVVFDVARNTAKNSSSMREDVRAFGGTEIDFINGYICWLGKKHRIRTPTNNMIIWMLKSKATIEVAIDDKSTKLLL